VERAGRCAAAQGDPGRIAELFADTVDWQLDWPAAGHPAVPWIRQRSTRADVADHFRMLNEFHVPEKRGGLAGVRRWRLRSLNRFILTWKCWWVRVAG